MAEDYDLTWEKHNEASFRAFLELRGRQSLVDVSLYCEGELVRAHKLVLAACSLYFERLFNSLRGDERHRATVVALPKVDVAMLKLSLDFMYSGKVTVPSEKLEDFMSFAEFLEIRGLKTEPGASSPSPSPSGAALPRAPNGNAPLHGGLRQVNAVFGSKKPAPSSLSPATPAAAAASSAAAGGGGGGGGGAKKSVKRPLPDIRPAASASPAAPGKGAVPAAAAVDPLAPTSSSGPSKAKKEAKLDVGSGAALVKAELGDDTEEGEGDYDAEDFEESYENYEDSMVMAQLGSEEDSTVPKNIPPSIVPDEPFEKVGKCTWRGTDRETRSPSFFCEVCGYTVSRTTKSGRHDIRRHEKVHTGERPFSCDVCHASFTRKEHLKRHLAGTEVHKHLLGLAGGAGGSELHQPQQLQQQTKRRKESSVADDFDDEESDE